MDILKLTKQLFLILITTYSLGGCASQCDDFGGSFYIKGWQEASLSNVALISYQKDTNLKKVEKVYKTKNFDQNLVKEDDGSQSLILSIKPERPNAVFLPINLDYKLLLNNKFEYKITEIKSSNRTNLDCPLESFKVNDIVVNKVHSIILTIDQANTKSPSLIND